MSDNPNILGLNAYHGDSSAALLIDGQLAMAVEEERFNRIKHWAGLPVQAAAACLAETDTAAVGHIAISRNPRAHLFSKLLRAGLRPSHWARTAGRAANGIAVSRTKPALEKAGLSGIADARFHFVEHHRAHMASAFFPSPFEEAAVISVDGFGDFSSVMWGVGRGHRIQVKGGVRFPHSLGLFYTAFTQFLGFPHYGDEYKMMGLSTYGTPRYVKDVRDIIRIEGDQIRLNLKYFRHHSEGVEMTWEGGEPALGKAWSKAFIAKFGEPRVPKTEITERDMDLAASAQAVLEEIYFALLNHVQKATGLKAVTLAGGVALNCVANGMIFEKTGFRDVYVQPAAHDAGTSIGSALYVWHQVLNNARRYQMRHVYYGTGYSEDEILNALEASGARYHRLNEKALLARTAREIANGHVVGWYQGRMEFGPRALGNRSILADPRRAEMKDVLNSRIKRREAFRPFCPSVLAEKTGEYFENSYSSPFMTMAYKIHPHQRESIAAVSHLDGTGRLQTVERDTNPIYWELINEFSKLSGVPVLLNTSFNENEPIVDTPHQALDCFLRTRMDVLVMGPYFLSKSENQQREANHPALAASGIGGSVI
jgi:carbamoyltransferase